MPKIIENVRENIVAAAVSIIDTAGATSCSVRAVSKECGIASGTVYNYFSSKEALMAAAMERRWQMCIASLDAAIEDEQNLLEALAALQRELVDFMEPMRRIIAVMDHPFSIARDKNHAHEKRNELFATLMCRVERLLAKAGLEVCDIETCAPTITRLLVMCGHDSTLDIRVIVQTCARIQERKGMKELDENNNTGR